MRPNPAVCPYRLSGGGKIDMNDFFMRNACFRYCPVCSVLWTWQSQFLSDPEVRFLGFRPAATPESLCLMLFNHSPCDTRMAFALETFAELTAVPILSPSCATTHKNEDYCLARQELRPCPTLCVCAFVYSVSEAIRVWPKSNATA
jgi:hypothetical protein